MIVLKILRLWKVLVRFLSSIIARYPPASRKFLRSSLGLHLYLEAMEPSVMVEKKWRFQVSIDEKCSQKNGGNYKIVGFPPKSSHFNRVFHYKPSIFGVPLCIYRFSNLGYQWLPWWHRMSAASSHANATNREDNGEKTHTMQGMMDRNHYVTMSLTLWILSAVHWVASS